MGWGGEDEVRLAWEGGYGGGCAVFVVDWWMRSHSLSSSCQNTNQYRNISSTLFLRSSPRSVFLMIPPPRTTINHIAIMQIPSLVELTALDVLDDALPVAQLLVPLPEHPGVLAHLTQGGGGRRHEAHC